MKKIVIYLHVFICALVIGKVFSNQNHAGQTKSIELKSCTAHVIHIHQGGRVNMFLDFIKMPLDKKGIVSLSGNYINNAGVKSFFSREISFDWTSSGNDFFLKSNDIHKTINDSYLTDDILRGFLSDFYIFTGALVYYKIIQIPENGYLFLLGDRPLFFCQN